MFIVVLFIITKMQKQPRHLPTDERIKRDIHPYKWNIIW